MRQSSRIEGVPALVLVEWGVMLSKPRLWKVSSTAFGSFCADGRKVLVMKLERDCELCLAIGRSGLPRGSLVDEVGGRLGDD